MKIISWNINGIRAILKKGFLEFLEKENADIYCFQETKISSDLLTPSITKLGEYTGEFNCAEKKGYSGTAIFSKPNIIALETTRGISSEIFPNEGRVITAEYPEFFLVNVYTPNSQHGLTRLKERMSWDKDFLTYLKQLEKRKPVIVCGDLNVAHKEIDLARPKDNTKSPGFTDQERNGIQNFIDAGFVDSFRVFNQEGGNYTWWSYLGGARKRNVGWRIDYFLISKSLQPRLKSAEILNSVMGSDHCPVSIEIE